MTDISWCCRQKKGIKIAEPNENLSKEYITNSDIDLKEAESASEKWKTIAAYYSCYEALYAVLQKIGIICEIHECTIALIEIIPGFTQEHKNFLEKLKKERIDVQYYLERPKPLNMIQIKEFILACKQILAELKEDEIKKIREKILRK